MKISREDLAEQYVRFAGTDDLPLKIGFSVDWQTFHSWTWQTRDYILTWFVGGNRLEIPVAGTVYIELPFLCFLVFVDLVAEGVSSIEIEGKRYTQHEKGVLIEPVNYMKLHGETPDRGVKRFISNSWYDDINIKSL